MDVRNDAAAGNGTQSGPQPGARPAVLAFDVGGTDLKAGLVPDGAAPGTAAGGQPDRVPHIRDLQRHWTPATGDSTGDAVVARIAELAAAYRRRHPNMAVGAVGVTVPGIVDEAAGVGVYSANLGWRNYPFRERLAAALGLPVAFGHDVALAGEAEFRIGAAAGHPDVVVLVIGTGIAGAILSDGRRIRGGGFAGELGHALVPGAGGTVHILESVASAAAVCRRYTEATGCPAEGARAVVELMKGGDAAAERVWTEAVNALAFIVVQCVAALGTRTVVLGGGLSMAGPALFEPLARRVDELLSFQPRPAYLHAALGENAGLIGSALQARDLLAAPVPSGAGA